MHACMTFAHMGKSAWTPMCARAMQVQLHRPDSGGQSFMLPLSASACVLLRLHRCFMLSHSAACFHSQALHMCCMLPLSCVLPLSLCTWARVVRAGRPA
eukprot:1159007-Pelagomonas_calceolata.AAC.3